MLMVGNRPRTDSLTSAPVLPLMDELHMRFQAEGAKACSAYHLVGADGVCATSGINVNSNLKSVQSSPSLPAGGKHYKTLQYYKHHMTLPGPEISQILGTKYINSC